jgi:hypothetical protein
VSDGLALHECREPEDLERLDRQTYVRLATTSVSMLDFERFRLAWTRALEEFAERVNEALAGKGSK